eukprot:tig00000492_g1534.t1
MDAGMNYGAPDVRHAAMARVYGPGGYGPVPAAAAGVADGSWHAYLSGIRNQARPQIKILLSMAAYKLKNMRLDGSTGAPDAMHPPMITSPSLEDLDSDRLKDILQEPLVHKTLSGAELAALQSLYTMQIQKDMVDKLTISRKAQISALAAVQIKEVDRQIKMLEKFQAIPGPQGMYIAAQIQALREHKKLIDRAKGLPDAFTGVIDELVEQGHVLSLARAEEDGRIFGPCGEDQRPPLYLDINNQPVPLSSGRAEKVFCPTSGTAMDLWGPGKGGRGGLKGFDYNPEATGFLNQYMMGNGNDLVAGGLSPFDNMNLQPYQYASSLIDQTPAPSAGAIYPSTMDSYSSFGTPYLSRAPQSMPTQRRSSRSRSRSRSRRSRRTRSGRSRR